MILLNSNINSSSSSSLMGTSLDRVAFSRMDWLRNAQ